MSQQLGSEVERQLRQGKQVNYMLNIYNTYST